VSARYDSAQDVLELTRRDGTRRLVPRSVLSELNGVRAVILRSVAVSADGDAIVWRAADLHVRVRGILERVKRSRRVDLKTTTRHTD
jgi:hypothetical protein